MQVAGPGWDLGPFTEVLQCLYLDVPLFQQQNMKKLHGTKNNCVHVQLGRIQDKRNKQTNKKPIASFESLEQRQGVRSKSRVLCMAPAHTTPPKGWAEPLSHPLTQQIRLAPLREWTSKEPVACSYSRLLGPQGSFA